MAKKVTRLKGIKLPAKVNRAKAAAAPRGGKAGKAAYASALKAAGARMKGKKAGVAAGGRFLGPGGKPGNPARGENAATPGRARAAIVRGKKGTSGKMVNKETGEAYGKKG